MTYIYALQCPDSGVIRYIGKANDPFVRHRAHINRARTTNEAHHSCNWIRSLLREGKMPTMQVLERVPDGVDWRQVERRRIEDALKCGVPLTNIAPGGEGVVLSESGRARIVEKNKARWANKDYAERSRHSVSAAIKEKHRTDPDYHRRCAEGARAGWAKRKKHTKFVVDLVRDWVIARTDTVILTADVRLAFPMVARTIMWRHLSALCAEGLIHRAGNGIYKKGGRL